MKYFNVHYNDKKVERIKGESIQDASNRDRSVFLLA